MSTLWLAQADETEGEHGRLIHFLVQADTLAEAEQLAWNELRGEWVVEPDADSDDKELWFFNGEIHIDDLRVSEVTVEQAIQNFTRGPRRH